MTDWGWDEAELVRRCRDGSDAAYAVLVRQHRPRLFTLAYRLTGDRSTAEDVVQETFLAAFRGIDKFEPKPSLAPWLNTMAVRIAKRAAGRERARPKASLDRAVVIGDGLTIANEFGIPSGAGDPHAAAENAELERHLGAAIARLPFKYRAAVILRHVIGLDYAEAAQSLGIPLNTFKSHLLRGTRLLRADLASRLDFQPGPASEAHSDVQTDEGDIGETRGEPALAILDRLADG